MPRQVVRRTAGAWRVKRLDPMAPSFDSPPERGQTDSSKWRLYRGQDILPLWVADMDFRVAQPIIDAVNERTEHGVFGYSDCGEEIAQVVVGYFERTVNWKVHPDWIVYSPGLGASIHTVCRMTESPGDEILTPEPIYHVFRIAPALRSRRRIDIPFALEDGEWRLDATRIGRAATKRSKVFQLCNPHNPNGKVFDVRELEAIAEECERHGLTICSDEVHSDLILDEGLRHIPIAALSPEIEQRSITLASPSKAYNIAGLNFAVAIIPNPELRERYRACARGQVISHLNPLGIAAAAVAWSDDGVCDDWLREALAYLRGNRDRLAEAVEGIKGISMPHLASTYLAWIDVSELGLESPHEHFERHGLGMSSGEEFGGPGWMRLNFGCSRSLLEEAIARLQKACSA